MIIKTLKITNSSGDSISFGRHFKLIDDFELSGLGAEVNYSDTTDDGSPYQNTVLDNRDFEIPFFIEKIMPDAWWFEEQRGRAYTVFNPKKNPLRLDITTKGGKKYYLTANLEAVPTFLKGFENDNKLWTKGLLQFSSGDPYFYQTDFTKVEVATWIGSFEFPLEIPVDGLEMGYRTKSLIANVKNLGQMVTGMTVRFKATTSLTNPSIINVNTYEVLKLNVEMLGGDAIEVSTYKGNKTAYLTRNNVVIDVFDTIDISSTFLQLEPGDNLFRCDAENGVDSLEVSMTFTNRYMGV